MNNLDSDDPKTILQWEVNGDDIDFMDDALMSELKQELDGKFDSYITNHNRRSD